MNVIVYTLSDPRLSLDDERAIRYVGLTTRPRERFRQHLSESRCGKKHLWKSRWVRELLASGLEPVMTIVATVPLPEAKERERELIAEYRSRGIKITNLVDGGEGTVGWKHTPEALAKMSAIHTGKTVSAEARARLSAAHRGRKQSAELVAKRAAAHQGMVRSPEARARMSAAAKARVIPPEQRQKMTAHLRGRKMSESAKAKIGAASRARHEVNRLQRIFAEAT